MPGLVGETDVVALELEEDAVVDIGSSLPVVVLLLVLVAVVSLVEAFVFESSN